MAFVLSSVSGNLISAASAGYAPTNSGDVSAIASAYQVVSATGTQLYAGTAFLTGVNGAPVSASRAGNAANASLATSAWYDGTGRLISALPDSAAVSAIASAYTTGKQDTLAFGYDGSGNISSIDGSSLAGQGGGEQVVTSLQYATSQSGAIIGSTTGYQAGAEKTVSADYYPDQGWYNYQSATALERLRFASDRGEVTGQIGYPFDVYMLPYGATNQGNIWSTSEITSRGALSYGVFYGPEDFRIATGVGVLSGGSAVLDFEVTSLPFNTNYGPAMWGHDMGDILDDDESKMPVFSIAIGSGSNEGQFLPLGGGSSVLDFGAITTVSSVSGINNLGIMGIGGSGGTGGIDSATCSAIASAYAESAASSKLDTTAFNSGDFYSTSNPSGFITGVDLSPYQTTADMSSYIPTSMSSDFQQASAMSSYALSSDVSATVDLVGTQSANWGGSALALSAGQGVKLEKVGDTLVVSNDETVLFTGESFSATLSESIKNFSRMYVEYGPTNYYSAPLAWYNTEAFSANDVFRGVHLEFVEHNGANEYCFPKNTTFVWDAGFTSLNATGGLQYRVSGNAIQNELTGNQLYIRKIVGINRTAEA